MNDDPTQLFPETHWKRYATEAVCVPIRGLGRVRSAAPVKPEPTAPALTAFAVKTLVKIPTQRLLS